MFQLGSYETGVVPPDDSWRTKLAHVPHAPSRRGLVFLPRLTQQPMQGEGWGPRVGELAKLLELGIAVDEVGHEGVANDSRVAYPLRLIRRLYRIEHLADLDELSDEERAGLWRERSKPELDKLHRWLCALSSSSSLKPPSGPTSGLRSWAKAREAADEESGRARRVTAL
jgi:hypothetical protein